jgi:hypothetical protein
MDERELPNLSLNAESAARVLRCDPARVLSTKYRLTAGPETYGAFFDELRGLCMCEPVKGRFVGRPWQISGACGEVIVGLEHDDGLELLFCRSAMHDLASLLPLVCGAWRRAVQRQRGPAPLGNVETRYLLKAGEPIVQTMPAEQLLRSIYADAVEARGNDLVGARIGRIEQLTQTLMERIHALETALAAAREAMATKAKTSRGTRKTGTGASGRKKTARRKTTRRKSTRRKSARGAKKDAKRES